MSPVERCAAAVVPRACRRASPLLAALGLCLAAGCGPYLRLQDNLEEIVEDARRGDMASVARREAEVVELANAHYGRGSVHAAWETSELAETYATWGWDDRAMALVRRVIAETEAAAGPCGEPLALPLMHLSTIHRMAGRWNDAEAALDRAAGICLAVYPAVKDDIGQWHPCVGTIPIDAPVQYGMVGAPAKAARAELTLKWQDRRYASPGTRMRGMSMLGQHYADYGDYAEALWYLRGCLKEGRVGYAAPEAQGRKTAEVSPGVEATTYDLPHQFDSVEPRCLPHLIAIDRRLGFDDEAAELEDWQRRLWARSPSVEAFIRQRLRVSRGGWNDGRTNAHWISILAFWHSGHGHFDEAAALYREALADLRHWAAKNSLEAWYSADLVASFLLADLGDVLERGGKPAEAVAAYEEAAELFRKRLHPRRAPRLMAMAGAARSLAASGQKAAAEAAWQRYLALAEEVRGRDHVDYAVGLVGLADLDEAAGRTREAATRRTEASRLRALWRRRADAVREMPLAPALLPPPPPAN